MKFNPFQIQRPLGFGGYWKRKQSHSNGLSVFDLRGESGITFAFTYATYIHTRFVNGKSAHPVPHKRLTPAPTRNSNRG
jgi:hypothetical protein